MLKTCIPQQQFDCATFLAHGLPSPLKVYMTKSDLLRYLTKSIFQKHPLSEGACTGCPPSTIWADQHPGKWWFKGKIIANFKVNKKGSTKPYSFRSLFFVPLCSSCCTLQDAWVERYLSQGGSILKHDWNHCFRTRTHPKTSVTDFKKIFVFHGLCSFTR